MWLLWSCFCLKSELSGHASLTDFGSTDVHGLGILLVHILRWFCWTWLVRWSSDMVWVMKAILVVWTLPSGICLQGENVLYAWINFFGYCCFIVIWSSSMVWVMKAFLVVWTFPSGISLLNKKTHYCLVCSCHVDGWRQSRASRAHAVPPSLVLQNIQLYQLTTTTILPFSR